MDRFKNMFNSRAVRNAVQRMNGSNGYNSSQLNNYNGYQTDVYTRDYFDFMGQDRNRHGKFDNYFGDYNRIIQVAPSYPFYYVSNDEVVNNGDFVKYLEAPNHQYPQFKVWQQIYSELVSKGYSDIFLWRKDGKNESRLFEDGKKYAEDLFRGITLVSGENFSRLTNLDKQNIVRITYGVNPENVFMGFSPSEAAQSWRKMQDEMGLHMTAFAKNAGMPIGKFIITAPSPEEFVKLRDKLQGRIDGGKNNGKVLYDYRPSDSKESQFQWVQFTSQDVQDYTKQLEFAEKKMSQSFGVPGTVKGTNDGENYATARVSEHIFIKYTIKSLVTDFQMQLEHAIKQRFELTGEIKVNIPLPEIADESKVKIEATKLQVELFDQKRAEGYTAQSIVDAYGLPESFLLLELESEASSAQNSVKKAHNHSHDHVSNEPDNPVLNALTKKEREELESGFTEVLQQYADDIMAGKYSDAIREDFETKMTVHFGDEFQPLYGKSVDDVADALADVLEVVDVADLKLTDEELEEAVKAYNERVKHFSESFAKVISSIEGEELDVKSRKDDHVKMVAVTESEHTRIVSELKAWTKGQENFPVRVFKTWNTRAGACPECVELEDVQIDVTALFINNPTDEIYEVQGGGLHPNCRCYVRYEMKAEQ